MKLGVCKGGSPWRRYAGLTTLNKGSRLEESAWQTMIYSLGPCFWRDRIYADAGLGAQDWDDDIRAQRRIGWLEGLVTCIMAGDSDHPGPLPSAAGWLGAFLPQLRRYWEALGRKCPVAPWNENIDHQARSAPAAFAELMAGLLQAEELRGLLVVPAAAEGNAWAEPYWQAMAPIYQALQGPEGGAPLGAAALHIYDGEGASLQRFHELYPRLPIYILEFGRKDASGVRSLAEHAEAVHRLWPAWRRDPLVRGVAAFTMPIEDGKWQSQWLQGDYLAAVAAELEAERREGDGGQGGGSGEPAEDELAVLLKYGGEAAAEWPDRYLAWLRAGGAANNFRQHALGLGWLMPTEADLLLMANEDLATANQLLAAVKKIVGAA